MAVHLGNNKSYDRKAYTVPSESVFTIDFNGLTCNYFRVNNMSNVTLYCGTASYPNPDFYDFKVNPNAVANFCEPVERPKLYIYNNTKTDAKIILVSWADDFDATFMAVSEITLNNEGVIKTDGTIKGFETELPPGENEIGGVKVTNFKEISNYLANISNGANYEKHIKENLDSIRANLIDANLSPLLQALNNTEANLDNILNFINTGGNNGYLIQQIKQIVQALTSASTSTLLSMIGGVRTSLNTINDTLDKLENNSGTGATGNEPITDSRLVMVTMGNLGDKSVNPNDYNLNGYIPNKIVSVSLDSSKEKIWVEVPCITGDNRTSVFIPWYNLENVQNKPINANLQADQIDSTEVVIEFTKTIENYEIVDTPKEGDIFLGITTNDGVKLFDVMLWTDDDNMCIITETYPGGNIVNVTTQASEELQYNQFIVQRG